MNCLRGSASKFYDYYESNGWTRQGFPIAKWEPVARIWSDRERGYDAERKARGGQTPKRSGARRCGSPPRARTTS